jgi:hypothetical protein
MIPGSFMNPPTGVLPFDMFRSFAPMFDEHWPLTPWAPPCARILPLQIFHFARFPQASLEQKESPADAVMTCSARANSYCGNRIELR